MHAAENFPDVSDDTMSSNYILIFAKPINFFTLDSWESDLQSYLGPPPHPRKKLKSGGQ